MSFFQIKAAIDRMFWRLGGGKFEPNQKDIDAMTSIAEWINRQKSETLHENVMLAKLYMYALQQEYKKYEDPMFAQKTLHQWLEFPLTHRYKEFQQMMNDADYWAVMRELEVPMKPEKFMTDEDKAYRKMIFEKHDERVRAVTLVNWSWDVVKANLNNQISEAINFFRNKK